MFYIALPKTVDLIKILVEGSLEPGIYDLTLAEQFAPLDASAEGIRSWTTALYHRRKLLGSGLESGLQLYGSRSIQRSRIYGMGPV